MPRVAVSIPADSDLLCESCGYVLNGLPLGADARCPECGKPTADSDPALRHPPAWERDGSEDPRSGLTRFLDTTAAVLFAPRRFFRSVSTRAAEPYSRRQRIFGRVHWLLSATLFGSAAFAHFAWTSSLGGGDGTAWWIDALLVAVLIAATYVFLILVNRLAARLTTWEASFRGYRLPIPVVMRALHYHAAHYLPVAAVAAGTVFGYRLLLEYGVAGGTSAVAYLYVLCGEVVLAAVYLFKTYWIAMRNMMYANG